MKAASTFALRASVDTGCWLRSSRPAEAGRYMVSYDLRAGLKKLDRPVLIVHGHQDPTGDKTAEDIHALIPGSTLAYINKCGHFPWIEQPEEFRRIVESFLK